jgi:hypothetical protein
MVQIKIFIYIKIIYIFIFNINTSKQLKKNKKYINKEIEFLLKIKINIFFPLWFKLLDSNKYLIVNGFYFINHVTHEQR